MTVRPGRQTDPTCIIKELALTMSDSKKVKHKIISYNYSDLPDPKR